MSRRTMLTQKILEQQKARVLTGLALWREEGYWVAPDEITGGADGFYLFDPRPLDQPDIPFALYAAEMSRRNPECPGFDWTHSYQVSCALRRYCAEPPQAPPKAKAPRAEPIDPDTPNELTADDLRDLD